MENSSNREPTTSAPQAGGAAEFDHYADDYAQMHADNIRASGEEPEYFAEYKVRETAHCMQGASIESIVDLGAGIGASVPHFRKYFPDAALNCVDVSKESLSIAQEAHGDKAKYHEYDGRRIPLDNDSIDLCFAACVFHHIPPEDHARTLADISRVLKPRGHFFLFEHNPLNPLTVHAVNTCPFDENAILIRSAEMTRRIEDAGLIARRRNFCVFFPAFLSPLRPFERALTWLPLGAQYFVWAQKP